VSDIPIGWWLAAVVHSRTTTWAPLAPADGFGRTISGRKSASVVTDDSLYVSRALYEQNALAAAADLTAGSFKPMTKSPAEPDRSHLQPK
jgi:hypothetical protein